MTRERAKELAPIIAAFGNGSIIEAKEPNSIGWYIANNPIWDDSQKYRIKPEPRTRPMTRGEVLYMVTTTPAMVVSRDDAEMRPAQFFDYEGFESGCEDYQYAIIDKHGDPIDGWHKFEVVE